MRDWSEGSGEVGASREVGGSGEAGASGEAGESWFRPLKVGEG